MDVTLLPHIGACELKSVGGETQAGGQDLALKSGPFESASEAEASGQKVLAGLVLASLRGAYGVSIQAQVPGGGVTNYGKKTLGAGRFDAIFDDAYGLTIFEDPGRAAFVRIGEMRLSIAARETAFVETWSAAATAAVRWDDRTLIGYDLYASSRFENSTRARFLLLIMAIEALVEQSRRSESEVALIERLLHTINDARLPTEQSAPLLSGVGMLKNVSISHACRSHLGRSIAARIVTDPEAAEHFTACYRIRGQIVHGGATPSASQLSDHSSRMETTVRELLMAAIEGRAV